MKPERNKLFAQIYAIINEINKSRKKPKKSLSEVLKYAFAKQSGRDLIGLRQMSEDDLDIFIKYLKEILIIRQFETFKND